MPTIGTTMLDHWYAQIHRSSETIVRVNWQRISKWRVDWDSKCLTILHSSPRNETIRTILKWAWNVWVHNCIQKPWSTQRITNNSQWKRIQRGSAGRSSRRRCNSACSHICENRSPAKVRKMGIWPWAASNWALREAFSAWATAKLSWAAWRSEVRLAIAAGWSFWIAGSKLNFFAMASSTQSQTH